MKRRVSIRITLIDEVEQALGLEIFANVGPALVASLMPQAVSTLVTAYSPEAARIQRGGSQIVVGEPRGHGCVAHHGR